MDNPQTSPVLQAILLLLGGGLIGSLAVFLKVIYGRRQLKAAGQKTEAEADGIVITGQSSVIQTVTDVANKFGDNVKQLLDYAQDVQGRYEALVTRYSTQLEENARMKAEIEQLTRENIRLKDQVRHLTEENTELRTTMQQLQERVSKLEDKM